jgi:uncharacterized protein with PIN domain
MKYFFARFYDSLKDFPGVQRRLPGYGAIMQLPLLVNQTVKDLAESLGVPHSEIAMILVNSKEVDFDYIIKDKDFVSFFPDFKTFDISGVTKINIEKPKEFKFILDVHLGKLAKYLRLLGFDAKYGNNFSDIELADISLLESRILLTRDLGLLKYSNIIWGYWLRNSSSVEQIKEVVSKFDLKLNFKPFSRCLECNGEIELTEKANIMPQLKAKTKKYFNEFYKCKSCGKIYWKGSHWEKMASFIDLLSK